MSRADRSGPASIRAMTHGTVSLPGSPDGDQIAHRDIGGGAVQPEERRARGGVRRDPGAAEHARPILEAHPDEDHRPDLERIKQLVEDERRDAGQGAVRPHDAPAPVAPERHVVLDVDEIAALGDEVLDVDAERVRLRAQAGRREPVAPVPPRERGVRAAEQLPTPRISSAGAGRWPGPRRCRSPWPPYRSLKKRSQHAVDEAVKLALNGPGYTTRSRTRSWAPSDDPARKATTACGHGERQRRR